MNTKPFRKLYSATFLATVMFSHLNASIFAEDASGTAAESKSAVASEKEWKSLFDGESFNGWRNYKSDHVSNGWKIVDGAMTHSGKAGDIITKEKFGAFELVLEFRIAPAGNSGVIFHCTEDRDTAWQTGPEVQIQDNVAGHDPQKCGWLYQLYAADIDATKPAGEWNELRLVITPEKCEHYMNGKKYVEYVKGSADWKAKVAASKFSQFDGFGEPTSGHICLQDHNDEVSYRNIRIRDLSK